MKQFALTASLLFFLGSPARGAVSESPERTDAALSAAIVGCWVGKEGPANGTTVLGITCYSQDGKAEMTAEIKGEKIQLLVEVKGTWRISKRKLVMTVTESTLPELFPAGETSAHDIISISAARMVLDAKDGRQLTRDRVEGFSLKKPPTPAPPRR
jgi:hypothetical protein